MSSKRLGVLLFCMVVVVAATTSTASAAQRLLGAPCPSPPLAQAFSQWFDYSAYTLVPGSTFESWSSGWSTAGANVVSGNEPFYLNSRSDSRSLSLPTGASGSAPAMCVGLNDPTVRFVASGSGGGILRVDVTVRTLLGLNVTLPVGTLAGDGTWEPTPTYTISLENVLSTLQLFAQPKATFHFTSVTGAWRIDDVYVDPWASRCC